MKSLFLMPFLSFGLLLGGCALNDQANSEQLSDSALASSAGHLAARFFEGLKEGRDDVYWPLMSPLQQSPGLKKDYKEIEPAMEGFVSWTSSPSVSTIHNLDATQQFPGPFYVVERTAKFSDGSTPCLIALVEFDRGNNGFVNSIYRGESRSAAMAELEQAIKDAG